MSTPIALGIDAFILAFLSAAPLWAAASIALVGPRFVKLADSKGRIAVVACPSCLPRRVPMLPLP